jgi:hypothetical protein
MFFPIAFEQFVPLQLSSGTLGGMFVILVVYFLRYEERFLGVEAKLLLDLLDIVGLQGIAVNTTSALQYRAEPNSGRQLDHGRLIFGRNGAYHSGINSVKVGVTIFDMLSVPAIGFEPLYDIFAEGAIGISIFLTSALCMCVVTLRERTNGYVIIIVYHDELPELQMTSQ